MASPSRPPTNKDFGIDGRADCWVCGQWVKATAGADFRRHNDGTVTVTCQACLHRWLDDRRLWLEQFNKDRNDT